MLSRWCIVRMKPSVRINAPSMVGNPPCKLWSVCFTNCVLIWLHKWDFVLIDSSPTSIRQDDKCGEGSPFCIHTAMEVSHWRLPPILFPVYVWNVFLKSSWQAPHRSVFLPKLQCSMLIGACIRVYVCFAGSKSPATHWSEAFAVKPGLCLFDLPLLPSFFLLSFPDTPLWQILSAAPVGK